MVIRQGDVFWVDLDMPSGSEPGRRSPCVVVQNDVANGSRLRTVIVCAVTSRVDRARHPGNVLLESGEGDLPRLGVVNVSHVITVDKSELIERIGTLSAKRVRQILDGIRLFLEPRDLPEP